METIAEWKDWYDSAVAQYNAGQISQDVRDAAQREYELAMARLGASTGLTKQAMTVALVLGGLFIFTKYGKR